MIYGSQCAYCVHWNRETRDTCAAFPDRIPDEILMQPKHDHTLPYPGDHGIRFTPIDARRAERQKALFALPTVDGPIPVQRVSRAYVDAMAAIGKPVRMTDGKTYRLEVVDDPATD